MELFTVAVITYQQRHHLERCLKQIFCQDYKAIELIVCDDNSCDFYEDEVEAYIGMRKTRQIRSVTIQKQPSCTGKAGCLKTALSLAHGTYVLFLEPVHELCSKEVLSKLAACFRSKQCSVLVSRSLPCLEDGRCAGNICPSDAEFWQLRDATPDWLFVQYAAHPKEPSVCSATVCFRKDLLDKAGFDTDYPSIPFWMLWLKICAAQDTEKVTVAVLDEITVHTCIYQAEDDLGYLSFGMKDRYYLDSIRLLREYALPEMKRFSATDRARCRHAAAVLQIKMEERKWYTWRFKKRLLWKIKKMPVLCMGRLYRMRTGNFYIDTQKELKMLLIFSFLYYLHIPLSPEGNLDAFWALLAAVSFAVLALKTAVKFCTGTGKAVLDKRADRRADKRKTG